MPNFRIFPLFCLLALLVPCAAQAQRINQLPSAPPQIQPFLPQPATSEPLVAEGIAAVVNDAIVSISDVRARMALAIFSSNLQDAPEIRARLVPQILRTLVDEQLQLQESKRLDISVSTEEVKKALDHLAEQNNIPGGDMEAFLSSHGVPSKTLVDQARATLAWNKVVARTLRPRVDIGDDEVQAVVDRVRANAGKQEYLVSEIFLSIDNPKDEEQTRNFAEQLVQQIKNGGNFGAIARQFSQGTGAASGGDIGWIQDGQLSPELNKALLDAKVGDIVGPVRSTSGFHILGVREQRTVAAANPKDMTVRLEQVFLPFPSNQPQDVLLEEVNRLRDRIHSCSNLSQVIKRDFRSWYWQDLGTVALGKAPTWLVEKTATLPVGHPSEALTTSKGALVLFVCTRDVDVNVNREEIMTALGMERLELLARRQMRDMRRAAYIDIRLSPRS